MRAYHPPMRLFCMRSLKVSVPVTARTTPNTARSARSGEEPPRKGRPPSASTHSLADCSRRGVSGGRECGQSAAWPAQLKAQIQEATRRPPHPHPSIDPQHSSQPWQLWHPSLSPAHRVEAFPHIPLHPILLLQLAADAPHHARTRQPSCRQAGRQAGRQASRQASTQPAGGCVLEMI